MHPKLGMKTSTHKHRLILLLFCMFLVKSFKAKPVKAARVMLLAFNFRLSHVPTLQVDRKVQGHVMYETTSVVLSL